MSIGESGEVVENGDSQPALVLTCFLSLLRSLCNTIADCYTSLQDRISFFFIFYKNGTDVPNNSSFVVFELWKVVYIE